MARTGRPPANPLRRVVAGLDVRTGQAVAWCDGIIAGADGSDDLALQVRWTALTQIPYQVMPNIFVRPSFDSALGAAAAMLAVSTDVRIVEPMPDEVRSLLQHGMVLDV